MVSSRSQCWYMYLVLMALPAVSVNTAAELQMPESTIISDFTQPVVDYIMWYIEEFTNLVTNFFDVILYYLCFPIHYITKVIHSMIDFCTSIPIMIISLCMNTFGFIIKFLLESFRSTINALFETVLCFPVNGIVTLVTLFVHGPLHFLGFDLRPQLVYYIVSTIISVLNVLQGIVNFFFDVVSYIVIDVMLYGLLQSLLELPVWTVYAVIRFPVILLECCIEITSSALIMLIHRILVMVCSLLRLACFLIIYTVIFICYWSLDIFLLITTVIIGLAAWLTFAAILLLIYVLVRILRRQDNIWTIAQKVIEIYGRIRDPHVRLVLELFFDLFPKEIWSGLKRHLQQTPIAEGEDEETICVVCYDSSLLVKLIPCGHKNTCKSCIEQIQRRTNTCPMCRTNIAMFVVLQTRGPVS